MPEHAGDDAPCRRLPRDGTEGERCWSYVALVLYAVWFGIAAYMVIAPRYDELSARAFIEWFQEIAVRGNVPINRQMETWSPAAPPPDWENVRDRWLRYHGQRGAAEIVGFLAMLAATQSSRERILSKDSRGLSPMKITRAFRADRRAAGAEVLRTRCTLLATCWFVALLVVQAATANAQVTGSKFELFVTDAGDAARFYEVLGFSMVHEKADGYSTLRSGSTVVALSPVPWWLPLRMVAFLRHPPIGTEIVLYTSRLDQLREEVIAAGYEPGPIALQSWGDRDFRLTDPDGYYVRMSEGRAVP